MLSKRVLTPVHFDNQTGFNAHEIDDVRTDWKLAFELCSFDLA